MSRSTEGGTTAPAQEEQARFELERFAWGGPDRLVLAGRFAGIDDPGEPVLVVAGAAGTQRLSPDQISGPAQEGDRWEAAFAWNEAPAPFEAAELHLGDDLVVALPTPDGRRRRFGRQMLEVRSSRQQREPTPDPAPAAAGGTDLLRLRAELVVAQEDTRALRDQLDRSQEQLAATRAELEAERVRHAEDGERFRREIASVSASAQEAVAADRLAAEQVAEHAGAQEEALATATTEAEALRARVAQLEKQGADVPALRARVAELEREVKAASGLRAEHEGARAALDDARSSLEDVLARLRSPGGGQRRDEAG